MRGRATVVCTLLLSFAMAAGAPLASQAAFPGDAALDSLATLTAQQIARYADRRVAIAEGYRPIGGDFPGMGEHWIHPGALLANRLDATRPMLLIYAGINGHTRLLGVGFVIATRAPEAASRLPGWPHAWHEHSGLLADESGVNASLPNRSGTRVWVLHIWTALPNHEGPYAPDNWALPFARLGLEAPEGVDADAGRALSLAVGGDRHLRSVLTDAGLLTPNTAIGADSIIAETIDIVERIAAELHGGRAATADDTEQLRSAWKVLSASLRELLGPAVDQYMNPPHRPATPEHPARSSALPQQDKPRA